jgi:hypothetical protein
MTDKDDETPSAISGQDRDNYEAPCGAPRPFPSPAYAPPAPASPAGDWHDEAPVGMVLEAMSYITCPSCEVTYIKGDKHTC